MNQIKKLMDKITLAESRQAKDVVLPLNDAKLLRDEIMSILLEQKQNKDEPVSVVMRGNKW